MGNIKTVNLSYHEESGNTNRRVKYGDKNSFSRLVVSFSDGTTMRHFEFDANDLPDTDSIHLKSTAKKPARNLPKPPLNAVVM